MVQLVEQVDETDTDSVNFPLYRFESCPDYNELITQMDVSILKDTNILLGVGKSGF